MEEMMYETNIREEITEIDDLLSECEYQIDEDKLEEIKEYAYIVSNLDLNEDEKYELERIQQRIENVEIRIEGIKEYEKFLKNPEVFLGI